MKALLFSIPHAGEQLPPEAFWLKDLPEKLLMCDVDRFVDKLYDPVLKRHQIPGVVASCHRYAVDLNRWPDEVDRDSLQYSVAPSLLHPRGLHWRQTTKGQTLLFKPLDRSTHHLLLKRYYDPFFEEIDKCYRLFQKQGFKKIYHLDLHSMPSKGTAAHRDPHSKRPDIVLGSKDGKIQNDWIYKVRKAYESEGFEVALNTPYKGGAIVERYDCPGEGRHSLMVELNRKLYMDEENKTWQEEKALPLQKKLESVITQIYEGL